MQPLLFNLDSDCPLSNTLLHSLDAERGEVERRSFPDEESYLRVLSDCKDRQVLIFCNLFQPNEKVIPLIFLAATLRELGAGSVGLITPYLAYMRQDIAFHSGECVTSRHFAAMLSQYFDWLVTVDPHLHRYHSLDEIYQLQGRVAPAAPVIAKWIQTHIENPLLIGPDSESEQWVSQVAQLADAPFQILNKIRRGDYDVEVSLPDIENYHQYTPVLVDDIISSGKTMLQTLQHLEHAGLKKATAIGVHGLFAQDAYQQLSNISDVVTCNTVPHPSNQICVAEAISQAVLEFL
jgi:ribose-phosphate pyrophosphokinase